MQEDERLFTQHNENRVAELGKLRQDKQPCPEAANFVMFNVAEKKREKLVLLCC